MGGPDDKPELAPTAHDGSRRVQDAKEKEPKDKKGPDRASLRPGGGDRPSMRPGGPEALIGTVLSGRYRIEKVLGEGGMGAVYEATHTLMKKRLAVKVLHPEMSRLSEVVQRFEREATAAAHIEHPNVASATDFGKLDDGSFFLVLEYVEGQSLRDAVGGTPLELGRALHITRQIASALQRAHALGIVHRDLKPENIMLVERDADPDFVKLLDFGIAKVPIGRLTSEPTPFPGDLKLPLSPDPKQPVLTQLGMVYGTPEYMAPEQALGQPVDARADLYALGIMMYEMLTGKRPFDHESKVALLGMHVTAAVPPMSPDLGVPADVEAIVRKLLSKESSERIQEARELIDGLNQITGQLAAEQRIEARYATGGTVMGVPTSLAKPLSQSGETPNPLLAAPLPPQSLATPAGLPSAPPPPNAPPIILTPPPRSILEDRRKLVPLAATVTGFGLLLLVMAVVLARSGGGTTTGADAGAVATGSASGATDPSAEVPRATQEELMKDGLALVEKGDFAAAVEKLEALTGAERERTDVRRGLVLAYGARKAFAEAMREATLLVKADPKAGQDVAIATVIRDAALGKEGADDAFALLETGMSQYGLTILYEMAFSDDKRYPAASKRAQAILRKPDVRGRATPTMQVNLDIRAAAANPCGIKAMLERARETGDEQTAALLKPLTAMKTCGGGMRGREHPCPVYPCLMGDGQLRETIATIDARTKKKP
jgi:serine/threonine-protein kinase